MPLTTDGPPLTACPWWRGAVLYQVYLCSFADGDGDGLGDLRGLIGRLDHIAGLGVDGLWLGPFYPTPDRDFGYDVSDHCAVDPRFGTLDDFDHLLREAHARGLKVIIDQVWSHTAAEHPWFTDSRASRDNPKADWYVWADPRPDGSPPNNWQSWMGGSAWRWEPRRGQYHLHNFLPTMPDLNLHHPPVQEALLAIADFWLARGVDGFRLDTANLYFHDRQLRDNPALPPERRGRSPVLMQEHRYNADQPETLPFLEALRRHLDAHGARMAVGEIGGANWDARMAEYTEGTGRLHTAYSFAFLGARPGPAEIAARLDAWSNRSGWPSWAFSNHDVPRVATRWSGPGAAAFDFGGGGGADTARGAVPPETWMALLLALRGTIFIYQGEELGLEEAQVPPERMRDPFGLAHWPLLRGRDGCRTPMPWQADAAHAGFSAVEPWLPVADGHRARAVDRQAADPHSMLSTTRRLLHLRRAHEALRHGELALAAADDGLLHLVRRGGASVVQAAFNLGTTARRIAIAAAGPRTLWSGGALPASTHLDLPPGAAWYGLGEP